MKTPWGSWEVLLDEPDYKIKRITVLPGRRLSYQAHDRRDEHWIVVRGRGVVTRDGTDQVLGLRDTADVPAGCRHRIANDGEEPLVFVEIQTGSYLGEDDIVRFEDDYGRATKR